MEYPILSLIRISIIPFLIFIVALSFKLIGKSTVSKAANLLPLWIGLVSIVSNYLSYTRQEGLLNFHSFYRGQLHLLRICLIYVIILVVVDFSLALIKGVKGNDGDGNDTHVSQ
jgi:hypothetical protein